MPVRRRSGAFTWMAAASAAVLLVTMTDQVAAAAKPSCPEARSDPLAATVAATACGARVEVLSQRTETTQVWARPEGGFSTEIYAGPVRFQKGSAWQAVDLTLRKTAGGAVEPVGHPRGLRLSGAATGSGERVLARVETGGDVVSMLWTGPLPAPVLAANTATYREVRPGVDLLLTATRLGFEQSLVVKDKAAAAQVATMTVPLRTGKLRFVADGPGSFAIRDAAGATVGRVPAPMMWDSSVGASGERTREKALAVQAQPQGSARSAPGGSAALDLRLTADQAWLRDPKTKYPVTLDPQVELDPTSDTIVRNDEPSTSGKPDHSGADYLAYGKATSYLARSYMQWPSAQFAGARVTSATLNLWNWYSGSCAQTGWLVWNAAPYTNPIWWDTAPALLSNDGYSTQTAGFSSACNDAWVSASVVPMFQRAADSGAPIVYAGLTSYNETNPSLSWKQVRSLQAPVTSQILFLRINYEYPEQGGLYRYGVNYPYGLGAVDYAYSNEGMWKDLTNLRYGLNRYQEFFVPHRIEQTFGGHDVNEEQLRLDVQPSDVRATAVDKNRHLLFDADRNVDLDESTGGFAFHEHDGRGQGGVRPAGELPYHLFWFDDNWLARYLAQAYGRPQPNGLSDVAPGTAMHYIRWRILSGDQNWTPHDQVQPPTGTDNFDRLALDGLYYLSAGPQATAMTKWRRIIARAEAVVDSATKLYTYPKMVKYENEEWRAENYHIGLAKLLTDQILAHHTGLTPAERGDLVLHSVSLRALVIQKQQRGPAGQLAGWTTGADLAAEPRSLMNIETLAVNALALGAGAKQVYSPGQAPLQTHAAGNYRLTGGGLLQAVPGTSTPGHMTFGPNHTFAPGSYNAEFVMRSLNPAAGTQVANIEVYDARTGASLAGPQIVTAGSFAVDGTFDRFIRFTLPFTVASADNSLEFRVWWYGGSNPLDIAEIRVR